VPENRVSMQWRCCHIRLTTVAKGRPVQAGGWTASVNRQQIWG